MTFADLALHDQLLEKLNLKGFENPTPIQETTIPLSMQGKDVIACAKTGSGKTLAFLLPIIHELLSIPERDDSLFPLSLILAPTRELALQITEEARTMLQGTSITCEAVFGGVEHDKQRIGLSKKPAILVATPGRLLDFISSKDITLQYLKKVVLDEADRMLDMGFIDDVRKILSKTKVIEQFSLFSATMNYSAIYSVWEFMKEPEEILINPELVDTSNITQELLHLGKEEKLGYIVQLTETTELEPIIIFTNSKQYVQVLVDNLVYHNIPAQGLSSVVNQGKRLTILKDFKERKFRVLVATDVASRGLHIEDVQLVINYDIPQDAETYVHRIGRTARAGKTGKAMSICSEIDYDSLTKLERYLKYKIPVIQPEEKFIENLGFVRVQGPKAEYRESRGQFSHKHQRQGAHSTSRSGERPQRNTMGKQPMQSKNANRRNMPEHDRKPKHHQARHEGQPHREKYQSSGHRPKYNEPANQTIEVLKPAQKKGFWARIVQFFRGKNGINQPRMSDKTREYLEGEARELNARSKKHNNRSHSGKGHGQRKKFHKGNRKNKD